MLLFNFSTFQDDDDGDVFVCPILRNMKNNIVELKDFQMGKFLSLIPEGDEVLKKYGINDAMRNLLNSRISCLMKEYKRDRPEEEVSEMDIYGDGEERHLRRLDPMYTIEDPDDFGVLDTTGVQDINEDKSTKLQKCMAKSTLQWISMFTNISDMTGYPNQPEVNHRRIDFGEALLKPDSLSDVIVGEKGKTDLSTAGTQMQILPYAKVRSNKYLPSVAKPKLQVSLNSRSGGTMLTELTTHDVVCDLTFEENFKKDLHFLSLKFGDDDDSDDLPMHPLHKIAALLNHLSTKHLVTTKDVRDFCIERRIPFCPPDEMPVTIARAALHRIFNDCIFTKFSAVEGAHRGFTTVVKLEGMKLDQKYPQQWEVKKTQTSEKSNAFDIVDFALLYPKKEASGVHPTSKKFFLTEVAAEFLRNYGETITSGQQNCIVRREQVYVASLIAHIIKCVNEKTLLLIPDSFWKGKLPMKVINKQAPGSVASPAKKSKVIRDAEILGSVKFRKDFTIEAVQYLQQKCSHLDDKLKQGTVAHADSGNRKSKKNMLELALEHLGESEGSFGCQGWLNRNQIRKETCPVVMVVQHLLLYCASDVKSLEFLRQFFMSPIAQKPQTDPDAGNHFNSINYLNTIVLPMINTITSVLVEAYLLMIRDHWKVPSELKQLVSIERKFNT